MKPLCATSRTASWPWTWLLPVTVAALLAACGGPSERQLLSNAQQALDRGDSVSAILDLKTLLQTQPESPDARLLLGKALLGSGDAAGADLELQRAVKAGLPAPAAAPWQAEALLAQGRPAQVIQDFGAARAADAAGTAHLKTQLALALVAQEDRPRARALVDEALRQKPDHAPALVLKARLVADAGDEAAAKALVADLLRTQPRDAQAWMLEGDLRRRGSGADAAEAYRKAVGLQPNLVPAHAALIALQIQRADLEAARRQLAEMKKALPQHPATQFHDALLAYLGGQPGVTRDIVQRLLRGAPDNPRLLYLGAQADLALGGLVQAEAHLGKAVALAPDLAEPRLLLAQVQLRRGQPNKALDLLKDLLAAPKPPVEALVLAGQAHLLLGDLKQAEASFQRGAQLDPGDRTVRLSQALSALARGKDEQALGMLRTMSSADSKDTRADLALISTLMRRNDFDAALQAVLPLEQKLPRSALPEHLRGQIALARRDAAAARASFDNALTKDARHAPSVLSLARLDLMENKVDAARSRLEALLRVDTENVAALQALAEVAGQIAGSADAATALLERAAKARPGHVPTQARLIEHHLASGDAASALAVVQSALATLPDDPDLLDLQGQAQLAAGDARQAVATFLRLGSLRPASAASLLRLAEAERAAGDERAADALVDKAGQLAPNWLPAQRAAMDLALRQGQPDRARAMARALQARQPAQAIGWRLEGDIDAQLRNWDAAAAAFRKALDRQQPEDAAVRLHFVLVAAKRSDDAQAFEQAWLKDHADDRGFIRHLGEAALLRGDWAAAEAQFRRLVELQPNDVAALNNLAYLQLQQGRPEAQATAEKAASLAPRRAQVLDTLAQVYARGNQLDKAVTTQARAVALAPANGGLRLTLARLQLQAGDKDAAGVSLDRLAELGKRFSAHAEVDQLRRQLGRDVGSGLLASRPGDGPAASAPRINPRTLQLVLAGLVGLLVMGVPTVLFVAALRPAVYKVERSIEIDAPAATVFEALQDLLVWEQWAALGPYGPKMYRQFARRTAGTGAVCDWKDVAGRRAGHVEVMRAVAPASVNVEVVRVKPDSQRQLYEFSVTPIDDGRCTVRCAARGSSTYGARVAGVFFTIQRQVGRPLQTSLTRLKSLLETPQPAARSEAGPPALASA